MPTYLLDTNHASRLMADLEPLSFRVRQAQSGGVTAQALCHELHELREF
jgi:hypothetical protein